MLAASRGLAVLFTLGVVFPAGAQAQGLRNLFCPHPCAAPAAYCQQCRQPAVNCVCHGVKPVVENQVRQEPVVTYRDVTETQYREESYTETVPITTYQNVTVDEGSYQTVWVPKKVTRQVPRTTYHQIQKTRSVPYQVTRRVPHYSTRTVSQQVMRYVPHQYQTAYHTPGCSSCGGIAPGVTAWSPLGTSIVAAAPLPASTNTSASLTGTIAPIPDTQVPQTAAAEETHGDWTTVPSRSKTADATDDRFGGYKTAPPRSSLVDRRASKFIPAPSAATVWRAQSGTVWR